MKITGQGGQVHLFIDQAPIVRPENAVSEKAIKEFFNFKAEKFEAGYNPGIKKNDLTPELDDYMLFPFRLLSACIVGSGTWKSTDFSNTKILKASLNLLAGKPAYLNHNMYVGNEIGTIGQTVWSNGYTAADGTKVPAGIDGPYVIDSKLFPELCRKLNAPIPSIQSSSVTVFYDWESSHDFKDEWDFYRHLGTELDGMEVTRVVTKITDYVESSLVYLGADPYAKKKDNDGNLINIDRHSMMSNSAEDSNPMYKLWKEKNEMYVVQSFSKENSIPLRKQILENQQNEDKDMVTELQKFIATQLNVKPEEVTEETIKGYSFVKSDELATLKTAGQKVTSLETEKTQLTAEKTTLTTEKDTLSAEIATLKTEKAGLETHAKFGKELVDAKRIECVEAYTKASMGKPDQVIIDEINKCDEPAALNAKLKMFGKKMIEEFGGHCDDCGGKKISYRSSQNEGDDTDKNKGGEEKVNLLNYFRP